jgi:hypothetical protein
MITPMGSKLGQGTIAPGYESDEFQMKLGFFGVKNRDGSTGS